MKETILAFDAASSSYSVGVFQNGKKLSSVNKNSTLTHSQTLLPTIKTILKQNELEIKDIDKIALTVGPGSFTGLKIAVATAKGLSFPQNIPCVPLSTLEAMAYGHIDFEGIIACNLDARRKMIYNAFFACHNGEITRISDDRQISAEKAAKEAETFHKPLCVAGDGADILSEELTKLNIEHIIPIEKEIVSAEGIFLAAKNDEAKEISAFELIPRYLRKPQAERDREEKMKINT